MAGALGGDHDDIDASGRLNQTEVDGKAVSERERLAFFKVGQDVVFVNFRLLHVGTAIMMTSASFTASAVS